MIRLRRTSSVIGAKLRRGEAYLVIWRRFHLDFARSANFSERGAVVVDVALVNTSVHMAGDRNEFVFVVDLNNDRVLLRSLALNDLV